MTIWDSVASAIRDATHRPFTLSKCTRVSGGSINQAYCIEACPEHGRRGTRYFIKLNDASRHAIP